VDTATTLEKRSVGRPKKVQDTAQDTPGPTKRKLVDLPDESDRLRDELSKSKQEYALLLSKYEHLKTLRLTDAESMHAAYRKSAEERFSASDALIDRLKRELSKSKLDSHSTPKKNDTALQNKVELLELQLRETQARVRTPAKPRMSMVRPDTSRISELEDVVEMFNALTGLYMEQRIEDDVAYYDCVIQGRNGTFEFTLYGVEHEAGPQVHYTPRFTETSQDLKGILPAHFQDELFFAQGTAEMFFWRLLNALQKKAD
jgi:hypothetical protein